MHDKISCAIKKIQMKKYLNYELLELGKVQQGGQMFINNCGYQQAASKCHLQKSCIFQPSKKLFRKCPVNSHI